MMVDAIVEVLCLRLVPLTMQGSYLLTTDNKDLPPPNALLISWKRVG